MILAICVAFLVLAIGWFIKVTTRNYGVLEAMGIPVVKPFLCFGSGPFAMHTIDVGEFDKQTVKDFGDAKTWGRYDGSMAMVYTTDLELIKEVFIKEFDHFRERIEFPIDDDYKTLDILDGEPWKFVRKGLSPVFTSGKLKGMVGPINSVVDRLIIHLNHRASENKEFDVEAKNLYQATTLEAIMKIAFGVEGNFVQKEKIDTDNDLFKKATQVMAMGPKSIPEDVLWNLFQLVPAMSSLVIAGFKAAIDTINAMTKKVMDTRESEDADVDTTGDFIGRLIGMAREVRQQGGSIHGVNENMVVAQGSVFLLAGFETTASTLSTLTLMLAKHPEVQQRIYEEICEHVGQGEDINYETVTNFKYMEAAIQENLRHFPPVPRNVRRCSSDVTINGLEFKKGTQVQVPVFALHMSKEYYGEDVEEFNPDRFYNGSRVDIQNLQFHAFGEGPRTCIGMRFAFTEMKMILGRLLFDYEILEKPGFEFKLDKGAFFLTTFDKVQVKFRKRN